jgi:hypothetical protein
VSASPFASEPVDLLGESFSPFPPRHFSSIRSPPDPLLGREEVDAINSSFASATVHSAAATKPAGASDTSLPSPPSSTSSFPGFDISLALPNTGLGPAQGYPLQGTEAHPGATPRVRFARGSDPQGRSVEDCFEATPLNRTRGSVLGRRGGTRRSVLGPTPLNIGSDILFNPDPLDNTRGSGLDRNPTQPSSRGPGHLNTGSEIFLTPVPRRGQPPPGELISPPPISSPSGGGVSPKW